MIPTADKGRFLAFGRVFSGTIATGKKVGGWGWGGSEGPFPVVCLGFKLPSSLVGLQCDEERSSRPRAFPLPA